MKFLCSTLLLSFLLISQAEDLRRTYASWKIKFNKKSSDGLRSEIERYRYRQIMNASITMVF